MGSDKTNVRDAMLIFDNDYQKIFVAFDIENHAIIGQEADVTIFSLDVRRRLPIRLLGVSIPGSQHLLRIRVPSPKIAVRSFVR